MTDMYTVRYTTLLITSLRSSARLLESKNTFKWKPSKMLTYSFMASVIYTHFQAIDHWIVNQIQKKYDTATYTI